MSRYRIPTGPKKTRTHRSASDPSYEAELHQLICALLSSLYDVKDIELTHRKNRHKNRSVNHSHIIRGRSVIQNIKNVCRRPTFFKQYHKPRSLFSLRSLHEHFSSTLNINISFHTVYHAFKDLNRDTSQKAHSTLTLETLHPCVSKNLGFTLTLEQLKEDYAYAKDFMKR